MADAKITTVTTTRRTYSLRSPTNWVEIQKVLAKILSELASVKVYDDTVTVEAWDDEIRFSFEPVGSTR